MTDDQAEIGSIPTDEVPPPDSLTGDTPTPVDGPASEPSIEPAPSPVPTAPEPPAPTPAPEPPQSEPVPEPTPPQPAPSIPEPMPVPKSEPPVSSPTPALVPEKSDSMPPSSVEHHVEPKLPTAQPTPPPTANNQPSIKPTAPQTSDIKPQVSDADIVASLTDSQLKAAASLYAKKNQKALSLKGVEARRALAHKNITAILDFTSHHSTANNRTIARALNLPPRRVQHYMQQLTHRGDVIASGWGISREYRIKK